MTPAPPTGHPAIIAAVREAIRDSPGGAVGLAQVMAIALYHPEHGYYRTPERRPGRGGDFLTAPEVHPFFGITIARQIADLWHRMDRPDPFTVREYGPGVGGLAWDIIGGIAAHDPDLFAVLRYRLRDVNRHRTAQAMTAMTEAGLGGIVSVEGEAPPEPITGVVLANEVADALPAHRLVWRGGALHELFVVEAAGGFAWREGPLSPAVATTEAWLAGQGVDVGGWPDGAELAWSPAIDRWVEEIDAGLTRGYALIIDYGYPAAELYREHRLEGTIRTYAGHTVGTDPLVAIGEQDITAHVDFSRITDTARRLGMAATAVVTQADFLTQAGLGGLLVDLQRQPDTDIAAYYRAQAAVLGLIDPVGLGRFRVVALAKGAPVDPPPIGFRPDGLPETLRF